MVAESREPERVQVVDGQKPGLEAQGRVETRWDHPMLTVKGDVDRDTRARLRAAWMAWGVEPSEWVPWIRLIDEAFGARTWEEGAP